MKIKRRTYYIIGLTVATAFFAVVGLSVQLLEIGLAYKAMMLCSEVFVAKRKTEEVIRDLELDDLKLMKVLKNTLNRQNNTATSSFLRLIKRSAFYRENTGCTLEIGADDGLGNDRSVSTTSSYAANKTRAQPFTSAEREVTPQLRTVLDDAFSEPDPAHLRRTRAIVIVQNGQLIAEKYAEGFGADSKFPGWSMAKSVLNALVATLVKDGKMQVNKPVLRPEWRSPNDERSTINFEHLLTMTSGLAFNENMSNPLADVTRMLFQKVDMASFAANKKLQYSPGTVWQYSSGNSNIISRAIRDMMNPEEYIDFPRRRLIDRIGMDSALVEMDSSGSFVFSSYMYATARDWAAFGMLYLNDGVWGSDRIFPQGWVDYTRSAADKSTQSYGAHFWLKIPHAYNPSNAVLPTDTLHAVGHEGQFVTIVPAYNAVIVRLGKTRYAKAWDHGLFVSAVLKALQ